MGDHGHLRLAVFHQFVDELGAMLTDEIAQGSAFLREAIRCLKPGGRIFMLDQHVNWLSRIVLRYGHHEPFDPDAYVRDFFQR